MIKKANVKIKIFSCIAVFTMMFSIFELNLNMLNNTSYAALPKSEIKENFNNPASVFPDSYKGYISALKNAHPNWNIKAFYTNLDWNNVVNSEASGTYSRVQDSGFSDAWKRVESKNDQTYNASGFVLASKAAVAYTLDPRNFLNDKAIFQFRVVDQNVGSDTQNAVNEAMTNTPMKNTDYDDIITKVGKEKNVSPLFIIARIRQETGCNTINNKSINGKHPTYPGYYNFFNIGAKDSSSAPVKSGLALAKSRGWNTPEKALSGGIDVIKNSYINYGQNTIYFQKFDVANPYGNAVALLAYQYMSNISAPESESEIIYEGMSKAGILNNSYTFYIPVYNNMPTYASPYPGQVADEYIEDNTRMRVKASVAPDILNVRSGPGTGYASIAKLNPLTQFTRIKKSKNTQWDMIRLDNGITGYVFREYIEDCQIRVNSLKLNDHEITMKLNDTRKLDYTIEPSDAYNKEVEWQTSNANIVSVENGNITAKGGGEATITIKSKDTGITDTCKVKVIVDVENITLPKTSYKFMKGKSYQIIPTITPDGATNKEYNITSENNSVIEIDGKNIKAVGVGNTNIKFTTVDQNKTVTANVEVIEVKAEDALTPNEEIFNVDKEKEEISKIEPETKLSAIKDKIKYNNEEYDMVVKDLNGNVLNDDGIVGTGTTFNLTTKDTKDELQTYTVVIYGDTSGDGKISTMDYTLIKNHIMDVKPINNTYQYQGADVNGDGIVKTMDYTLIKNHIMDVKRITVR